ncbi:DUF6528 family protein [Micromonospora sp. HM5-17]|uniref:DUF6528 family protein n=1 Tax=Micromonospora sp. HM5-17 TaxID=2487710 RepID=UPI000F4A702B|nr:DUF6528 family protein [Micromonospora sp. HM5-17]ROT33637.1 hypothetical protein EF879_01490 [Micromonospora sp. HM5-17]
MRKPILAALLVGAVGATTLVGATALVGTAGPAVAADNYYLATTEQVSNRVLVWNRNVAWTEGNLYWQFSPGTTSGAWQNLSDVRIRATAAFGTVALVTASGGRAAIIDVKSGKPRATTADILWQATPGGNPHAIERITDNGSIVVASSAGTLKLYAPTKISDPSTLALVQTISLPGAHGVLYDPTYKYIWAIGQGKLVSYAVTGTYRNTRLVATGSPINLGTYTNSDGVVTPNLGHDLQPSYTDPHTLFITHTTGVFSVDTTTRTLTRISSTTRVKAYVNQAPSGERAWVRGDNTGSRTWGSPTVQFFDANGNPTEAKTVSGAEFYKVRTWTTAFE